MRGAIQEDLRQFLEFLSQQVDCDPGDLTPEDLLDRWRASHPLPGDLSESAVAVRQALADMRAGDRGRSAEQVIAELRQRLESSAQT